MSARRIISSALLSTLLAGCAANQVYPKNGVTPVMGFPVTSNDTPYSDCLAQLADTPASNLPVFAVGEAAPR